MTFGPPSVVGWGESSLVLMVSAADEMSSPCGPLQASFYVGHGFGGAVLIAGVKKGFTEASTGCKTEAVEGG